MIGIRGLNPIPGLPTGLSISSSTGLISGTVGSSASARGPFTTTVTVTDGTHTAVNTFSWYVDPAGPIVISNPGSLTSTEGDQLAFFIQAVDSNGGSMTYSATGLPAGLYVNALTGLLFGTISSGTSGSHSVTVTAGDGSNQASQTFAWTVNAA